MKAVKLPQDSKASTVQFGVELETIVPITSGIEVGHYHRGIPVRTCTVFGSSGSIAECPSFRGTYWKAELDSSIVAEPGFKASEFVSPILVGDEGVAKLRQFVSFLAIAGAKVNPSCGCHITVSIPAIIGSTNHSAVVDFIRKLAVVSHHNAWAIYAQTGAGRHNSNYAHPLPATTMKLIADLKRATQQTEIRDLANSLGRGMVNFRKAFQGPTACIEFRAFAGTLDEPRLMHHLATAIGLMRYSHERQVVGAFNKSSKKFSAKTAPEALRRFWRSLGWADANEGRTCATGLFGSLHSEFHNFKDAAMAMAEMFETQFPAANL